MLLLVPPIWATQTAVVVILSVSLKLYHLITNWMILWLSPSCLRWGKWFQSWRYLQASHMPERLNSRYFAFRRASFESYMKPDQHSPEHVFQKNSTSMYSHCGCWNNRLTWILGSLVRWIHCGSMSGYGVHTEVLVDRGRKITWSTCRRSSGIVRHFREFPPLLCCFNPWKAYLRRL